jgi:type II secretory pathway component PulJ
MNRAKSSYYKIDWVRGYTFVETLITVLIFSIVMISMYSVFQTGSIAYKKMDSAFELYQEARIIFNRLDADLSNSFVYGKSNSGFYGDRQNLAFYTLLDSFSVDGRISREVAEINYEFLDSTLRRTQTDGLEILMRNSRGITEDLTDSLKDVFFQFAIRDITETEKHYTWQDIWPIKVNDQDTIQQNSLPLAVKVEMILEGIKFIKIIPLAQSYLGGDV